MIRFHHAAQSPHRRPGALHHVICRGIERRKIFPYDTDRDDFIRRLAAVVKKTQTFCYAWALIPTTSTCC